MSVDTVRMLGWREVAAAQFQLVARTPHPEMIVLAVLGVLMALTRCNVSVGINEIQAPLSGSLGLYPFALLAAAVWSAGVWHDEGPTRRGYHWSLPVDRGRHDLLRVGAGAAWLALGVTALLVLKVASDLIFGGVGGPWLWVGFLTGPLTVYLFGSALALRVDHPGRWLAAIGISGFFVWAFLVAHRTMQTGPTMDAVLGSPAGPVRALFMAYLAPLIPNGGVAASLAFTWLPAAVLWLGLGAGAVWLAARYR